MIPIALCASTHRAARVLANTVNYNLIGKDQTTTAHKLFKLRPTVNASGKELITSSGSCKIKPGSLVIIDEASMIGNSFLKAIVDIVKKNNLKLLFVGDPFQLPPVSDRCSIFDGSLATYTLTTVHRQLGGNPILEKANEFREYIEGIRNIEPTLETNINSKGEGIHVLPHADFVTKFVQKYMNYTTGTEVDVPLCTYTNESAINYNAMIRKASYFLDDVVQPFYPGEILIANSVVMESEKVILTNNETVRVLEYEASEYVDIPGYLVTVRGDFCEYLKTDVRKVFSPITPTAANRVLNEYKKQAIREKDKSHWVHYYNIKNALADLRPPFAGTTHKAQGGTFPAIFIDKTNINKCRDKITRARLFYVALTRATTNVYINS
jgi:exodeoxyribonuclease-5